MIYFVTVISTVSPPHLIPDTESLTVYSVFLGWKEAAALTTSCFLMALNTILLSLLAFVMGPVELSPPHGTSCL